VTGGSCCVTKVTWISGIQWLRGALVVAIPGREQPIIAKDFLDANTSRRGSQGAEVGAKEFAIA
jgi:hypothetical protein